MRPCVDRWIGSCCRISQVAQGLALCGLSVMHCCRVSIYALVRYTLRWCAWGSSQRDIWLDARARVAAGPPAARRNRAGVGLGRGRVRPAGVGSDFRYNPMKVKETRIFLPCGARQTKRPTKHHATVANRRSNVQVPHYQPRNFTTGQSNFDASRDRDSAEGGPYACPHVHKPTRVV